MSKSAVSSSVEVLAASLERGRIRAALFDFDGTISLIRSGWQAVMIPLFVDELARCPEAEDRPELERVVRDFVDTLTGKQTIYQCLRLAEEVGRRGGRPAEPLDYKYRYLDALGEHIQWRLDGLRDGTISPADLRVAGSRELLVNLRQRGITCYLASGTDEPFVVAEADALEVTELFDGGIGGARDDYHSFSKAQVIDRILTEHGLRGPELVAFGDGYVEIENTVAVGGIAVGAATDEEHADGRIDEWKRARLIGAGAHVIVPDFGEHQALMAWLMGEPNPITAG